MEMLGSEINILSIISKSAILLVFAVIFLLILPYMIFIFALIYFMFSIYSSIVIAFFYKKKRREEVVMKILNFLLGIDNRKAYKRGYFIGRLTRAIQEDWVPKLVGGKKIAKILIDYSVNKYDLYIAAFLRGLQSQINKRKNKDTINFLESLEKESKSNETEDE